ncbi:MAG: SIS domain-containing protein [Candidatus Dormibacteraceae bacterium]
MSELADYVARAKKSLYFSAAGIATDLRVFLEAESSSCDQVGAEYLAGADHLFLVGSGGSFASLQTAKYILDRMLDIPADVLISYELIWRDHCRLGPDSVVILASYSGETEDTVAALRHARERDAKTVVIVGKPDSTMAREADVVIPYDSGAIYEIPIAAICLAAAGAASKRGQGHLVNTLREDLAALPDVLTRTLAEEEGNAEERARELLHAQHIYVLGSGPLSPLAYKLAMSVVMENVRIGASFSDASEWRHGPAEALERMRGNFIVLLGTDDSRGLTSRTIDFCRAQGSAVMVYDAAEFGAVHPLLTPLVMNSHTQWFVVYSAILRGITDLDVRVFMGHNVLAEGGAGWP